MKKIKENSKLLIIILVLIIIVNPLSNLVYAEVNNNYYQVEINDTSEYQEDINNFIGNSVILKYVGKFIYAVARIVEKLIRNFSSILFGVNVFPWEDLIVFNSIPYLDINFFNPSDGSIFGFNNGAIGNVIRTVYFTLLTLALSILGIGVAIMAIRLAISSIASEKAKYKEAIIRCLYTVIMLFSLHFLLSFIFYANEMITNMASRVLNAVVTREEQEAASDAANAVNPQDYYDFYDANTDPNKNVDSIAGMLTSSWIGWSSVVNGSSYQDYMNKRDEISNFHRNLIPYTNYPTVGAALLKNSIYSGDRLPNHFVSGDNGFAWNGPSVMNCLEAAQTLDIDIYNIVSSTSIEDLKSKYSEDDIKKEWFNEITNVFTRYTLGQTSISNIITNLADTFKQRAVEDAGTAYADYDIVSVLLYAVFLVQSLMLLFAYVKRLFYVILLSIIGPIVVIYDFFMGTI